MMTAILFAKQGCKTKDICGPAPFPSEAKRNPDESDEQDHATVSPHPGREPGPSFSNPSGNYSSISFRGCLTIRIYEYFLPKAECFYSSSSIQEFLMCLFFVLSQGSSTIFHYKMARATTLNRPHMPNNATSGQWTLHPPGLSNDHKEQSPSLPTLTGHVARARNKFLLHSATGI